MQPQKQQGQITLTYLASAVIPNGTSAPLKGEPGKNLEVSELSGLVYLPPARPGEPGTLRAVGDKTITTEKFPRNGAKALDPQSAFYDFKFELSGGKLKLEPVQATPIGIQGYRDRHAEFSKLVMPGKFIPDYAWDTEDIVQLDGGRMLIALEGFDEKHKPGGENHPRIGGGLAVVESDGLIIKMLDLPDEVSPAEELGTDGKPVLVRGQRPNLGLEAAGVTEDGKFLMAGFEAPLVQDGKLPGLESGAITRIYNYERDPAGNYKLAPGYTSYPLEKIVPPEPGAVSAAKCDNGLVDVLPISATRFLAMERATIFYEDGRVRNSVRIYDVKLGPDGKVASKTEAFNSKVLEDQADIAPSPLGDAQSGQKPPGGQRSENLEGLGWGPPTESGKRTVIVCGDNNNRKNQRTLIAVLEVDGL